MGRLGSSFLAKSSSTSLHLPPIPCRKAKSSSGLVGPDSQCCCLREEGGDGGNVWVEGEMPASTIPLWLNAGGAGYCCEPWWEMY